MQALIILDCQTGFYNHITNNKFKQNIDRLIHWFKQNHHLIIAMKHLDFREDSIIC